MNEIPILAELEAKLEVVIQMRRDVGAEMSRYRPFTPEHAAILKRDTALADEAKQLMAAISVLAP